jgi:hypothetical protein
MGFGEQLVAVVPRGIIFRAARSGRLYGEPRTHYYMFDGDRILVATPEERELTDIFPVAANAKGKQP